MRATVLFLFAIGLFSPAAPAQLPAMDTKNNPLHCDPDSGVCAVPEDAGAATATAPQGSPLPGPKPITLLYFTDPICSACWGVEPRLRRLMIEHGGIIDLQTRMGGLLARWEGFNDGGMTSPADIAPHWEEMSAYFRMPMLGDVWNEDPLSSSYPPSIAFKAAELQDKGKALLLLRRLRELAITEGRNIARPEVIAEAAASAGLDAARLQQDQEGAGKALFEADLLMARSLGVRGFPTFIFINAAGDRQVIVGARPYERFAEAVKALAPDAAPAPAPAGPDALFAVHPAWCAEEAAEVLGITHAQAEQQLRQAEQWGALDAVHTRNGSVWRRK